MAKVDLGALRHTLQDEGMVAHVVEEFLGDAPLRLQAIRSALEAADLKRVALEAHSLKGAARYFGIDAFVSACAELEALARAGRTPIEPAFDRLVSEWQLVGTELRALDLIGRPC
jgi:HPt (histidine-containing phosphotransfer) domain-containing protein